MQLQRSSLLLRWAYFWSEFGLPQQTDLCTVFWRSVLLTPLKLVGVGLAVCFPVLVLILAIRDFGVTRVVLFLVGLVAVFATIAGSIGGTIYVAKTPMVGRIKKNYCPIITVKD